MFPGYKLGPHGGRVVAEVCFALNREALISPKDSVFRRGGGGGGYLGGNAQPLISKRSELKGKTRKSNGKREGRKKFEKFL